MVYEASTAGDKVLICQLINRYVQFHEYNFAMTSMMSPKIWTVNGKDYS